jgi:hypothetical protein
MISIRSYARMMSNVLSVLPLSITKIRRAQADQASPEYLRLRY